MKGDFTRNTFDPAKHFSRVLMQQGRVQIDADWNEQASILLHYLQTLAADLIGPYGGPKDDLGFEIKPDGKAFTIGKGRYYVDGILCENDAECSYSNQPDYPMPAEPGPDLLKLVTKDISYSVYLDVWERHLTHLDDSLIREVALGGPDTATRAKVVWQVKLMTAKSCVEADTFLRAAGDPEKKAKMKARLAPVNINPDPCITAPDSKYRGTENQLYRVEIHQSSMDNNGNSQPWTFKWSRDNGAIVAAWLGANDDGGLIVSSTRGFEAGGWVEIASVLEEKNSTPGKLVKIVKVEGGALYLDSSPDAEWDKDKLVKFRRWDQREVGKVVLANGAVPGATGAWLPLKDGLEVWFEASGDFHSGDYWLIPARVATGQIEWPYELDANGQETDKRKALSPFGIQHHYAPLAFVTLENNALKFESCRCPIIPPCPEQD